MITTAAQIRKEGNQRLIEIEGSSGTDSQKAIAKIKVIHETAQQLNNIK